MCWTEYTTRYYGCGATTWDLAIAPGIQDVSTRTVSRCNHMNQLVMLHNSTIAQLASNSQTVPTIQQWALERNFVLCQPTTYWAEWRSTRHCRSDGLHGSTTCSRIGVTHPYPRA